MRGQSSPTETMEKAGKIGEGCLGCLRWNMKGDTLGIELGILSVNNRDKMWTQSEYIHILYVYYMYIICILYVYYMYIICILYVYYMYIICILYVYYMYIICILYVYYMYIICILYVYYMYIICILYVYYMYIICILYVYYMYIICILYVYIVSVIQGFWTIWSQPHVVTSLDWLELDRFVFFNGGPFFFFGSANGWNHPDNFW